MLLQKIFIIATVIFGMLIPTIALTLFGFRCALTKESKHLYTLIMIINTTIFILQMILYALTNNIW